MQFSRYFKWCFCAVAILFVMAAIIPNLQPLVPYQTVTAKNSVFPHGGDFSLRINEVDCLKLGVNPYDVWIEKVKLPPYLPYTGTVDETYYEPLNAYTPWAYVYALPLSLFSHDAAWIIYLGLMVLTVFGMLGVAYMMGKELRGRDLDGMFVASFSVGLLCYPLFFNFVVGNYDLVVMAVLCLMGYCLNRRLDLWAGICWAVAMTKPQLALLFAVPLLWRRKFLVCAVAGGICLALTCAVGLWCHTSPIDLILQGPAASAHCFYGSGTMPYYIVRSGAFGREVLIAIGCVLGILVCLCQTWVLRKQDNWFVFLLPAFVCATAWTYSWDFSQLMVWPLMVMIAVLIVKRPHDRTLWLFAVLSAMFLTRAYSGYNFVVTWCSGVLGMLSYSEELHRELSALNSGIVLIVATVFFVWYARSSRFIDKTEAKSCK